MDSGFKPREATIQFNDVYGELPLFPQPNGILRSLLADTIRQEGVDDFDAKLTTQVRNTGRWVDEKFQIGAWPALGDYGVVLLDQLRQHQIDAFREQRAGYAHSSALEEHPDYTALANSVGKMAVVGVVNWAPRTAEHQQKKKNGEEFYMGVSAAGVEIFAQMRFFRGLHARGRLEHLFRIPNDSGVWPRGEQFRSSIVSQARSRPDVLQKVSLSEVPKLKLNGRLAYVDKFGNVRLEMRNSRDTARAFKGRKEINLVMCAAGYPEKKYGYIANINIVSHLVEIPEGELGIYFNPADPSVKSGPHYVELVRRVSDPNANAGHAYEALCATFLKHAADDMPRSEFAPTMWDDMDMYLTTE